ncbi:MAG: toxin-antitoxin system protein [Candidatus Egerieousia sp.]
MDTITIDRKQTAFRLRADLLERLRVAARKENRSLNNYVESVLLDAVYREPNEDTLAAMKEAVGGKNLTTVDTSSFNAFLKSLE